jgi:hypothetical protein
MRHLEIKLTAVNCAARYASLEVFDAILTAAGPQSLHWLDDTRRTPLHSLVTAAWTLSRKLKRALDPKLKRALAEPGIDVTIGDNCGKTAADFARVCKHTGAAIALEAYATGEAQWAPFRKVWISFIVASRAHL